VGIALLVGGSYGVWRSMQKAIAPFSAQELWEGDAILDKPYVWGSKGSLLVFHGHYIAFHIPTTASIPEWASRMAGEERDIHRYEIEVLKVSPVEGELARTIIRDFYPVSLILIYPSRRRYPHELAGAVAHFRQTINPMLELAQLWHTSEGAWKITVASSGSARNPLIEGVRSIPSGLLISCTLIQTRLSNQALWEVAWRLAEAAKLDNTGTSYLALSLMAAMILEKVEYAATLPVYEIARSEIERTLAWIQDVAQGRLQKERERMLAQGIEKERIRIKCQGPDVFCLFMKHEGAQEILDHWQQGEQLGHENYIRTLLEGDN